MRLPIHPALAMILILVAAVLVNVMTGSAVNPVTGVSSNVCNAVDPAWFCQWLP